MLAKIYGMHEAYLVLTRAEGEPGARECGNVHAAAHEGCEAYRAGQALGEGDLRPFEGRHAAAIGFAAARP
eukprot:345751-Prymnesium_polylepis.1